MCIRDSNNVKQLGASCMCSSKYSRMAVRTKEYDNDCTEVLTVASSLLVGALRGMAVWRQQSHLSQNG
eukprot:10723718-Lingulodinium_polyedra.AAC.1